MQKIKAKLNSKRGVSLLMALLLFLMCALSGAAAITAAGSNIGRYSYMREYQQEYLSVSSAAKLLKTQFEQGSGISVDCSGANAIDNASTMSSRPVYSIISSGMSLLLYDAYKLSIGGSPSVTYPPQTFYVKVEDDSSFGTVDVKVTFNKPESSGEKADIKVELSCGEHKLEFTMNLTLAIDADAKTITVTEAKVSKNGITLPKS